MCERGTKPDRNITERENNKESSTELVKEESPNPIENAIKGSESNSENKKESSPILEENSTEVPLEIAD